jgi:hypothetical protein
MAWLTVKLTGGRERAHEIVDDVTFLGSSEDCEIRLLEPQAAAKHCQVLRSGANLKLIDLGSPAGTLVNGQRVKEKSLLDGDVIQIGSVQVAFKAAGASPLAKTAVMPGPAAAATRPAAAAAGRPAAAGPPRAAAPAAVPRPAAAPAAPEPAPAPPRRPSRYAARAGRRGREDDRDEDTLAARAERRATRRTSSIWMTLGISAVTLSLAVFVVLKVLTKDDRFDEFYAKAMQERMLGNNEVSLQLLEQAMKLVPEGSADYVSARNTYEDLKRETGVAVSLAEEQNEDVAFQGNLKVFYDRYIDEKSKDFQGKNFLNDPTTARYFVEYRCSDYLARFPKGRNRGTVQAWAESLKRRYNEADPFPSPEKFWDHEVIATMEGNLEHHGAAVRTWTKFTAANPNHKSIAQAQENLRLARQRAETYAKLVIEDMDRSLSGKTVAGYKKALSRAIKAVKNLDGAPDVVAQVRAKGQEAIQLAKAAGYAFMQSEVDRLMGAGAGG